MFSNWIVRMALPFLLLLSLTACLGTTSPSRFYLLEPMREAERGRLTHATVRDRLLIALAPIRIPKYVDRPQIVTAVGKNAYKLNEFNRWAEPLDDNITRVLVQNLTTLVPAEVVSSNGSSRSKQAAFRVQVNILEFHADPQGQAELTAQWNIARGEQVMTSRSGSYRVPAATKDYPAIVEALNVCLNRLTRDLAAGLTNVAAER